MIVIKGNIPKGDGCEGCELCSCVYDGCCYCIYNDEWIENTRVHPCCPIVGEIPDKHGNLKDVKVIYDLNF